MLPDANDARAELDADATRRAFLKKVAIGGAVAAIGTQVLPFERLVPGASGQEDGAADLNADEELIAFLASLALAGAAVYRAATGDEATEGGADEDAPEGETAETTVPATTLPAIQVPLLAEPVVEVLRVFGSHHAQQAVALNGQLPAAVETPNGTLQQVVRSALGSATDEAGVLDVLRDLEERIAATHLAALGELEDTTDASLVAAALPIVGQHAVVLGLIGATPVALEELLPEEQSTDSALTDDEYPVEIDPNAPSGSGGSGGEDANAGGEGAEGGDGGTGESEGDGTEGSGGGADTGTSDEAGSAGDETTGN